MKGGHSKCEGVAGAKLGGEVVQEDWAWFLSSLSLVFLEIERVILLETPALDKPAALEHRDPPKLLNITYHGSYE